MSTEWFLHKDGSQFGPYTWEELCVFGQEGRIQAGDNLWNSGMSGWIPAQEVEGLIKQQAVEKKREEGAPGPMPGGGGEDFLGMIPALRKKVSFFSSRMYTLIVTNRRLIFAELTNNMLQAAAAEANAESKGKGFFTRMKEAATSHQRVFSRYQNMRPDEILGENPGNFVINNNEVQSVKMRQGHYNDDQGQRDKDTMIMRTTREKIKFTFQYDGSTGEAKKILWRALGNIVK
jgi:hypothetical protein